MSPTSTLVTEAYNMAGGQSEAAFRTALAAVAEVAGRSGSEVIVIDPSGDGLAAPMVAEAGPQMRYLPLPGLSYDQQKTVAVKTAASEVVVFLDGDCRPAASDWLDQLIGPFHDPDVEGVAGLTLYEDWSVRGMAMSVMDWGYLFAPAGAVVGCYASNNVAFRRSTWLACPPPDSTLRCNCYAHAQLLLRESRPLVMQPAALALHELPDLETERHRRGYDLVGACWVNPSLPETRWLAPGRTAAERFLAANLQLDAERLQAAPAALRLTDELRKQVAAEMAILRWIDRQGVRDALEEGEAKGWNARARADHADLARAAAA